MVFEAVKESRDKEVDTLEEEEGKPTPAPGGKTSKQPPKAPPASGGEGGTKDTRLSVAGEPSAKRPCTKGEGKGKPHEEGQMSEDEADSDTP